MVVSRAETRAGLSRVGATLRKYAGLLGVSAFMAAVVVPYAELWIGTSRARACIALIREPRGEDLPDCLSEVRWFVLPARIPWTLTAARYRAEELQARIDGARYIDAVVGRADPKARDLARAELSHGETLLANGSKRITLEDLGASVSAPEVGRYAYEVGDRATLLRNAETLVEWPVRLHALQAALMEGDVPRALAIAKHYAGFYPSDEDLRTAVAAMLCIGDDPGRGLELLEQVQTGRSSLRHEGMARDFGEVRSLMMACAALAKRPLGPLPAEQAGRADYDSLRAAQRIRLSPRGGDAEAIAAAKTLLKEPLATPGGRLALLAEVVARTPDLDADIAADLARPRSGEGEGALGPEGPLTTASLLDEPPGPRAFASAATLLDAASALVKISARATTSEGASRLRRAAGAMILEAGIEIARVGRADEAAKAMDLGGAMAFDDAGLRELARSSAYALGGLPDRALAELGSVLDVPTRSLADRAAIAWQRAELLASLGRAAEAESAALAADELARQAGAKEGAHAVDVYSRWTRLALAGRSGHGLRHDRTGNEAFHWMGFAEVTAAWAGPNGPSERALDETLGAWSRAVELPADGRRAARYRVFDLRGDAPPAHVAYLAVAARLLEPGEGDAELWLDALDAVDARRRTMRSYAWIRAESARWRGDGAAAKRWSNRARTLAAIAADPARAELARHLGI
jgi:hypothetical protein